MDKRNQSLERFFTDLFLMSLEYTGTITFNPESKSIDPEPLDRSYLDNITGPGFDDVLLTGQELLTPDQRGCI